MANPFASSDIEVLNFIAVQNSPATGRGAAGRFYPALVNNGIAGGGTDNVVAFSSIASPQSAISLGSGDNTVIVAGANSLLASAAGSPDNFSFTVAPSGDVVLTDSNTHQSVTISGATSLIFDDAATMAGGAYSSMFFIGDSGRADLTALYNAAFGRQPDLAGLEYHANEMAAGVSLLSIAGEFMASPEFQARYGSNASDAQFVTNLYLNVLHRTPGASEISYYTSALANNEQGIAGTAASPSWSRAQELLNFTQSPEGHGVVAGFSIDTADTATNGIVYSTHLTPVALGTLGGPTSAATAINASGQIGGYADNGKTEVGGAGSYYYSDAFLTQTSGLADQGTLSGDNGSAVLAINASGQAVGWSGIIDVALTTTFSGPQFPPELHAVLWSGGAVQSLGTLSGYTFSSATAINDPGEVVGYSYSYPGSPGGTHAFLWKSGALTDLGTLGGTSSQALGVDNMGQIIGSAQTSGGATHAFLWQPATATGTTGTMTDLGVLTGSVSSQANAINNNGAVVGYSTDSSNANHAFLWTPASANGASGAMTDLGLLAGGTSSQANALNNSGLIVGEATVAGGGGYHAVLWRNGTIIDLNTLLAPNSGWVLYDATGINDHGQIVGIGTHNGVTAAFELTLA